MRRISDKVKLEAYAKLHMAEVLSSFTLTLEPVEGQNPLP